MDQQAVPEPSPGEVAAKALAVTANFLPVVGGTLADVASEIISRRQSKRLSDFLAKLAEDIRALRDRINEKTLSTNQFRDLAEEILTKVAETKQEEKLDALRAIFLNTILSDRPKYDEAMEIANLVHQWQPRHIVLLKILSNPRAADKQMGHVVGEGGGVATSIHQILKALLPEWEDDQIERTWQDLYAANIHKTAGTRTMITDRGIHRLENRETGFGAKVASYLEGPSL